MQIKNLQSSERLLQTKVKNLTLELTELKKGYRTPSVRSSTERRNSDPGSRMYSNKHTSNRFKEKKIFRMRTPSPYQLRVPRFDPTAYIEDKQRRQVDIK